MPVTTELGSEIGLWNSRLTTTLMHLPYWAEDNVAQSTGTPIGSNGGNRL